MANGFGIAVFVEIVGQRAGFQAVIAREPGGQVGLGSGGDLGIDFRAVAGGQHRCFFHARKGPELVQRLRQLGGVQRHLLAQCERRGLMIQSQRNQWHPAFRVMTMRAMR